MYLVADSGSTSTHWSVVKNEIVHQVIFTKGINPYYQLQDEILKELEESLFPLIKEHPIIKVYFYGAGCAFEEKKQLVRNAIKGILPSVEIKIESDLLAAARSLFGNKEGIACILGTGSNSCRYDGEQIIENVSPLGFILGDEGSGAVLGKQLVGDLLKNQISDELKAKFMSRFNLTPELILENVYKKSFPNRFLAGLSIFLYENITYPGIHEIVYSAFDSFFKRNVMQYPSNLPIGFIGSVAFQYKDILAEVARKYNFEHVIIKQNPMDGLIDYHRKL